MIEIKNDFIKIQLTQNGGSLTSIQAYGKEYLWEGNPEYWGGQAPVLFPIVGRLKNDSYHYEGKTYQMKQHGFFRKSTQIELTHQTSDSATFSLQSNAETLEQYPFNFEFHTEYRIEATTIYIKHRVVNTGTSQLLFSLGEHPAFKCSLEHKNESYQNNSLVFEKTETVATHLINDGLIGDVTSKIIDKSDTLDLHASIFDKDALVFKNMHSRAVTLSHVKEGKIVTLRYEGFPYLGIWSKPNAPFVCIEPWLGIADSIHSTQKLEEKEGIISLEKGKTFSAQYSIEVHK
ncbi:MAG: aldose 1-epimerase family protein [Flavicella sp.]